MLKSEELSDAEKRLVRQELDEQRSERAREREDKLASVRLVGVTCAAASFALLDDKKFDIGAMQPRSILPSLPLNLINSAAGRVQSNH